MASFDDNPSPLSIELKEDETKDVDSSTYSVNIEQVKSFGAESSLGQDLSTLSSQSSKFDQDTSELDELLQQQHLRAGWFGLVERLPLFVKLFLMLAIALLGLIALGCYIAATQAKSIKNSRLNRSIGTLAIATGQLIHEIQRERDVSFNLVVTNSTRMQQQFEIEVLHTDKTYASFQRIVKKQTLALGVADTYFLDVFEEKYCFLPENRIETRKAIFSTSRQIFFTYSNCTNALFSFMQSYTADAKNSRMINALNNLMQLQDNAATTRGAVTNAIFLKGMTQLRYSTMVESFTNERLLETFLYASADKSVKDLYTEKVVPLNIQPASIVSAAVADYFYPLHNVTNFDEFWAISTARIDAVQEVCDFILSEIQRQAQEDMSKAAGGISALIIVIVLLLICSIVSAAIFSKAITGPWRRIIEVQETTIKKFVPKGFLRLLKCYRLADITLGKSVERDLTIMFADIRNYTQMSENMSPPQNFAFLNRYLASVGPVIRKYGGYIDKFMGDGLMACFPNTQAGLKSALEVQDVVNRLNMENTQDPAIRLGIGVHTGRVMIGAIGEDERMEGTLISDAVNLTSRLETLTKAFRAKVLTTSETMKRLKQLSDFPYRPLGYVKVKGKKQFVKVYELIDRNEPWKLDTAKEFKSAVDHMINHSYESAMILLEDITSKYPEDVGAQRVKSSCAIGYEVFREQVKNLQIHAALQDTVMKQAFLQFCTDERSEENFKFWQATEDYRQTDDDIKRIVLTKKIFQTFLSANAKHQVNTSDESKKKVKDAIISYDESLVYPPATLFNDLQTEIEILMNDTYTRFKKSSAMFMDAFRKVVPVPLVHIMDDDTL